MENKVLVVSSEISFVQELVESEEINNVEKEQGLDIKCYEMKLNTKYYLAQLDVWHVDLEDFSKYSEGQRTHITQNCEALVLAFRPETDGSFELIQTFLPFVEEYAPPIVMCVACHSNQEKPLDTSEYETWCVDNTIEFVEHFPGKETNNSNISMYNETEGMERIKEALTANMWPVMELKNNPTKAEPPKTNQESKNEKENTDNNKPDTTVTLENENEETTEAEKEERTQREEMLIGGLDQQNFDFDKALHDLKLVREKALNSTDDERKRIAAEVAMQFARGMFGDFEM